MTPFQNELSFLNFIFYTSNFKQRIFWLHILQNKMSESKLYSAMVPHMTLLSFITFSSLFSLMSMDCFYSSL